MPFDTPDGPVAVHPRDGFRVTDGFHATRGFSLGSPSKPPPPPPLPPPGLLAPRQSSQPVAAPSSGEHPGRYHHARSASSPTPPSKSSSSAAAAPADDHDDDASPTSAAAGSSASSPRSRRHRRCHAAGAPCDDAEQADSRRTSQERRLSPSSPFGWQGLLEISNACGAAGRLSAQSTSADAVEAPDGGSGDEERGGSCGGGSLAPEASLSALPWGSLPGQGAEAATTLSVCCTAHARPHVRHLVHTVVNGLRACQEPERAADGMGGTYFFMDDRGCKAAIVKPCDEEPLAPNNPNGYLGRQLGDPGWKPAVRVGEAAMREVAAYLLDHDNWASVPPTVLVRARHPIFHYNHNINHNSHCYNVAAAAPPAAGAVLPGTAPVDSQLQTVPAAAAGGISAHFSAAAAAAAAAAVNATTVARSSSSAAAGPPPPLQLPMKLGSLQAFVKHDTDCNEMGPSLFCASDIHRIGILDIRLLNTDRHAGNLLVRRVTPGSAAGGGGDSSGGAATAGRHSSTTNLQRYAAGGGAAGGGAVSGSGSMVRRYEVVPIDHGFCLPESLDSPYFEWLHWPQAIMPFAPDELEYIARLDAAADVALLQRELPNLRPECSRVLEVTTALLKACAAAGLTLMEIGSVMTRPFGELDDEPSELEALCAAARASVEAAVCRQQRLRQARRGGGGATAACDDDDDEDEEEDLASVSGCSSNDGQDRSSNAADDEEIEEDNAEGEEVEEEELAVAEAVLGSWSSSESLKEGQEEEDDEEEEEKEDGEGDAGGNIDLAVVARTASEPIAASAAAAAAQQRRAQHAAAGGAAAAAVGVSSSSSDDVFTFDEEAAALGGGGGGSPLRRSLSCNTEGAASGAARTASGDSSLAGGRSLTLTAVTGISAEFVRAGSLGAAGALAKAVSGGSVDSVGKHRHTVSATPCCSLRCNGRHDAANNDGDSLCRNSDDDDDDHDDGGDFSGGGHRWSATASSKQRRLLGWQATPPDDHSALPGAAAAAATHQLSKSVAAHDGGFLWQRMRKQGGGGAGGGKHRPHRVRVSHVGHADASTGARDGQELHVQKEAQEQEQQPLGPAEQAAVLAACGIGSSGNVFSDLGHASHWRMFMRALHAGIAAALAQDRWRQVKSAHSAGIAASCPH